MSRPKRARILDWQVPALNPFYQTPFYHPDTNSVRVSLRDAREADRIHLLVLSPAEAGRLGQKLVELARARQPFGGPLS